MNAFERRQRIVIKVGTSSLTRPDGSRNLRNMDLLARTLSDLKGMGHEIILVSSGAIGIGTGKLGLPGRPAQLRIKQAAAAVGQCEMMHIYDKFFGEYGHTVAQVLLTGEDVVDPVRRSHLSGTFSALIGLGVIPVVNENDSVSAAEIETGEQKVLGDNDTLSAIVAGLCKADLLIVLSDIDGLYDGDPRAGRRQDSYGVGYRHGADQQRPDGRPLRHRRGQERRHKICGEKRLIDVRKGR